MRRSKTGVVVAGLLVLVIASDACSKHNSGEARTVGPPILSQSVIDDVVRSKVLRVGFAGFPPYLSVDPQTKLPMGGFSVEVLQDIVADWNSEIKVDWVPTNWTNVRVDLLNRKFDLFVEPVFETIPRAAVVGFSRPYAYFSYAIGLVRIGEIRFKTIEDVNRSDVRICVMQGGAPLEYVRKNLPRATNLKILPSGNATAVLDETLNGHTDITLAEWTDVKRYILAHPGKVKAVFTDPPPGRVPGGFAFRPGDYRWAAFLDSALNFLEASGELNRLKRKYDVN